jgi:alpha-beta hydrolase superfamily lysophospholipase
MAENFIANGYDFYAVDLRRYGRSWRSNQKMCDIRNIKDYFKDIDTCLKIIKAEGATNTVILGHSTGGLTASLYAHHHPNSDLFQALILNSPFFDFNTSNFTKRTLLPFVFQKGKKHPDKLLKKDGLSVYGESISIKYHGEWTFNENWKPIETGPISYGWFNAIHQGHVEVSSGLKINQPTLILHSDHSVYGKVWNLNFQSGDAVLNVQDIQKESKKIMGPINIVQIKDGMHDLILSKIEVRTVVYEQIFNWCETLK